MKQRLGRTRKNWIDAISQDLKEVDVRLWRKHDSAVLTENTAIDMWPNVSNRVEPRTKHV